MAPLPTSGLSSLQLRIFKAATDGDLQLFKRTATALDAGKGCLKEAVEAVKIRGAGALHVAAGHGRMSVCAYVVEELLVDVNASDDLGYTPLAYAVRSGTLDTVQYLLDHDANPDKPNGKGSTPLHLAAGGGNCEIVKALLSKGANVDSFCDSGTPLHMAAFFKQDGAMKIFLDHHADCNKVFNTGCTPLFVAITAGSLKCVKLLIKAGADVKGVGTVTPLITAVNNGLTDFYNCLLEAGADPDVRDDAADQCPDDTTLYSNRCLCWLKMGKGDQALSDSGICRMQRPGWAKACYLQGSALMLLKDYEKACDAFLDGLKLDPTNVEIDKALWEAINCLKTSNGTK